MSNERIRHLAIVFLVLTLGALILIFKPPIVQDTIDQTKWIAEKITQPTPSLPYPTLESVFLSDHTWIATLSAEKVVTLIATGDVIPARAVNNQILTFKDFTWPYKKTAELTRTGDITFINLEAPQIRDCKTTIEGMVFCGNMKNVEGLTFAGVDIVSLANNHAGNHGKEGVNETVSYLENAGILATGTQNGPIYKTVKGVTFAFLGYNDISAPQPGVSNADEEKIKSEIAKARNNADVVVVTHHWGGEYRSQPDERQKYLGHFTIDNGADIVIGNHPHWIQPIEFYHGKLITYAHGNFVFDQMWSQKTREGVVGKYTFLGKNLVDVEYIPVLIENYGQPHFLEKEGSEKVLNEMKNESMLLKTLSNK